MRTVLEKALEETLRSLPLCPICKKNRRLPNRKYCSSKCARRASYLRNRERRREYQRRYYRSNVEKIRRTQRRYYEKNKDKVKKCVERYKRRYIRYVYKWIGKALCKKCGQFGYCSIIKQINVRTGYMRTTYFVQHGKHTHIWTVKDFEIS